MSAASDNSPNPGWHATTILSVRKAGQVVMAGDGQVSMGQTIVKGNAKKVRRLGNGEIVAGFAGATADAFTLFERLEAKLERHPGQLLRACIELAKDWRTDRYLRRLEAMMAVADKDVSLLLSGYRRRAGARGRHHRHRLGRQLRALRRAGADRHRGPRCRGDRSQGDEDRRRHLRLHQPQPRHREALSSVMGNDFSPREIVSELDKHIVGQQDAKRAVAIALRNRWRRLQLPEGCARRFCPRTS